MSGAIAVVIVCGVGIVLCVGYIVLLCARAVRKRSHKHEFEIEENVLTVRLGKNRKK